MHVKYRVVGRRMCRVWGRVRTGKNRPGEVAVDRRGNKFLESVLLLNL